MPYVTAADCKTYMGGFGSTTDDTMLEGIIAAAQNAIDRYTGRTFEASADTTLNFDPTRNVEGRTLFFTQDLAYVTSVTNGDLSAVSSSDYVTEPRDKPPFYAITLTWGSTVVWTWATTPENSIAVAGRWARMDRQAVTALARVSNAVTATVANTRDFYTGQVVYLTGVADTAFEGQFTLTGVGATTVTWAQTAADDTDTTGTLLYTPPLVAQATKRLVAWMYRQRDTSADYDRPALAGDGVVIMPSVMPRDVQQLLKAYVLNSSYG